MSSASDYIAQLLAVIAARDHLEKSHALRDLNPPEAVADWDLPTLPQRPGRHSTLSESAQPARRRKGLNTPHGRLRFLHAIWHIELSAVDVACVACLRGARMPLAFHQDFLSIARDEALHAGLIADLLTQRGFPPGSEAVHQRIWDTTLACADLGEHLVVVPRVLEARGLDVNADLLPRLRDDPEMHAVLSRIYHDEIRHVGIGTHWHSTWCHDHALHPSAHFRSASQRVLGDPRSPFPLDRAGRTQAGFSAADLDWLSQPSPGRSATATP